MMKGQLYICGENLQGVHGSVLFKYVTIILVTGVMQGGVHKGELCAKLVASGGDISLLGIVWAEFHRSDLLTSQPYFLPADYLTHQPIYSSRWSGNDNWHPLSVTDLPRYLNLPKKSILFEKILSGDYKRI
jgi:hypothetical protein